jgi:hypothetical protein
METVFNIPHPSPGSQQSAPHKPGFNQGQFSAYSNPPGTGWGQVCRLVSIIADTNVCVAVFSSARPVPAAHVVRWDAAANIGAHGDGRETDASAGHAGDSRPLPAAVNSNASTDASIRAATRPNCLACPAAADGDGAGSTRSASDDATASIRAAPVSAASSDAADAAIRCPDIVRAAADGGTAQLHAESSHTRLC